MVGRFSLCLVLMLLPTINAASLTGEHAAPEVQKAMAWRMLRVGLFGLNEPSSLPSRLQSYLNKNYTGWKVTPVADGCDAEFKGAFASGDFDGDGRRDYIVKLIRGRKGYIMAFLERRGGYEEHILHGNLSMADIRRTGIKVFRKGERVPVGDPEDESSYRRLTNDAPFDGPCESDAGGAHIYQDGSFN